MASFASQELFARRRLFLYGIPIPDESRSFLQLVYPSDTALCGQFHPVEQWKSQYAEVIGGMDAFGSVVYSSISILMRVVLSAVLRITA